MTTINSYGAGDPMRDTIYMSVWLAMEMWVGMIATCLPPLKVQMERLLKRAGLFSSNNPDLENVRLEDVTFVKVPGGIDLEKGSSGRSGSASTAGATDKAGDASRNVSV
jgi:hypothetical protein